MRPEDALPAAREAAARARHDVDALQGPRVEPADRATIDQLFEWAVVEPDPDVLRSTRRLGAPVTWAKRLAHRALQQELNELAGQQTRFNLHVLERLVELEERLHDRPAPGPERRGPG